MRSSFWLLRFALCLGVRVLALEPAGRRLVAIADLHGDLDAAMRALRLANLVDETGAWAGRDAILVQTGDVVDRGAEAKQLYALFQRLAVEAREAGGEVHNLLGNHEAMNMMGDVRYVNATDFAHFGGHAARAKAFSAAGELGSWLRSLPVAVHLGDTIFVHAGITKAWATKGILEINALARKAFDPASGTGRALRSSILSAHGPLWYRGFHEHDEARACANMHSALQQLGASRMVMGHNIQEGSRVRVRCGGSMHFIDIAMSAAIWGKHVVAWECVGCLQGQHARCVGCSQGRSRSESDWGSPDEAAEGAREGAPTPISIRAIYEDGPVSLQSGVGLPRLRDDLLRLRQLNARALVTVAGG